MISPVRTFEGGPPLSDADIDAFASKYGLTLTPSFRTFLRTTNGGRPERDLFAIQGLPGNPVGRIHFFFGLNDAVESCNLDWNLDVFRDRIPAGMLPIATTEGSDKVCLSVSGQVFYWDAHAHSGTDSVHWLAEDLDAFVASLRSDALSPTVLES
jgi:hypothetical protein